MCLPIYYKWGPMAGLSERIFGFHEFLAFYGAIKTIYRIHWTLSINPGKVLATSLRSILILSYYIGIGFPNSFFLLFVC
jgi:hypothetical protein